MFDLIKDFFRKRKINNFSKAGQTGLIPLSKISSVNIIIDVEETDWDVLKEDILSWGRTSGIKLGLYFFDFRKLAKDELLLTSIQTTIARKDLNWINMPSYESVSRLIEEPCDLFISLIDNGDFPIDFISKCSCAKFKIGRKAYKGHVYDIVISGKSIEKFRSDGRQVFACIVEFLGKISG